MHCKSLWIKASAKCINVNTLINSPRYMDHQNNVEHDEEVVSVPENLVA